MPSLKAACRTPQQLTPLLLNEDGKAVDSVKEWRRRRVTILKEWSDYLGFISANPLKPVINVLEEERAGGVIRQLVEYEGEPGDKVKAYLLKPESIQGKLPGVVALHSTSDNKMVYISGKEKGKILPMAFRMAAQGFIVICPVCFLWHNRLNTRYEDHVAAFHSGHPASKGMAKMLFDAMRAVDVLFTIPEVDRKKIGTMGHSLGAKESLYLGAFDERVHVIVSNEGGIGIKLSNWHDPWYLGKEINDFGHDHHEILALCAPKPFLLIAGEGEDGDKSMPFVNEASKVYDLFGKSRNLKFFNHRKGHSIPPEAEKLTYEWMISHLKA